MSEVPWSRSRKWAKQPMVNWYDPHQLMRTGWKVVTSSLFAEHSDARIFEAFAGNPCKAFTDFAKKDAVTIDYIADTGDGFDSSYAVLYAATEPELAVARGEEGEEKLRLPRADVLVLGGDEVYPVATLDEYESRLLTPMRMASDAMAKPEGEASPALFALPGNHDWYDSLVAFSRVFIAIETLGGWRTPQERSYFAIALPHDWWIFGTDVQLASDIDDAQRVFFEDLLKDMPPDAKVILCEPEPHWVYELEADADLNYRREPPMLAELERQVNTPPGRLKALIGGDMHHYRRHSGTHRGVGLQLITAGGGGAFLHPTHSWQDPSEAPASDERTLQMKKLECAYPAPEVTRRLAWKSLGFVAYNPRFLKLSCLVSGVMALGMLMDARRYLATQGDPNHLVANMLLSPVTVGWIVAFGVLFYAFTDTSSRAYRVIAGVLHGLVQAAAIIAATIAAAHYSEHALLAVAPSGWAGVRDVLLFLLTVAALALGGGIGMSFLMGVYLTFSLNAWGRHRNETFSAIQVVDYKSFLRMRVNEDGSLDLYALGIDRVPRKWKGENDPAVRRPSPEDRKLAVKCVDHVRLE